MDCVIGNFDTRVIFANDSLVFEVGYCDPSECSRATREDDKWQHWQWYNKFSKMSVITEWGTESNPDLKKTRI